jgi:hypothetical protein
MGMHRSVSMGGKSIGGSGIGFRRCFEMQRATAGGSGWLVMRFQQGSHATISSCTQIG